MRNRSGFRPNQKIAAQETPAEFFLTSLQASVTRINICMMDAGFPEEEIWQAFRYAISKLDVAVEEVDRECGLRNRD
jgi:hypothetical protein